MVHRKFNGEVCFGPAKQLLQLRRSNLRSVISILSGHCTLNSHLRSMGIVDEAACECGNGPETVFHFLGDCDRYCALRFSISGRHSLPPESIITMSLPNLTKFIVKSGRFVTQNRVSSLGGKGFWTVTAQANVLGSLQLAI